MKKFMSRRNRVTSLFSIVEMMQRRLEAEGLESNVVDVAVTNGLRTLFTPARNGRDHMRMSHVLGGFAAPATS